MFDPQFVTQFWPSFYATVFGGVAISATFFWLKEHLFSLPSITGAWECHLVVTASAYNPFKGMDLWYRVVLLQDGRNLIGRGEKYKDHAANQSPRSYDGKHRIGTEIQGRIDKNLTKPDVVRVHWSEDGEDRISSTICVLNISGSKSKGNLSGKFYSTAGECHGHTTWTRVAKI